MKRFFMRVICMALMTLLLSACGILADAAKLQEYDMSGDAVKTINAVVGERKVTGVETSTTNGVPQKQYTYESTSVVNDLTDYITYLMDNGWIATQDFDLATMPGSAQFGIQSKDEGKVIILSVAYEDTKYAIKLSKLVGTLEAN